MTYTQSAKRASVSLVLGLLVVFGVACSSPPNPLDTQLWIEESSEEDLAATVDSAYADLLTANVDGRGGSIVLPGEWSPVGADVDVGVRDDGHGWLELRTRGAAVVAAVEHRAEEMDHLRVSARSAQGGRLVIAWTTETAPVFDPARRLVLPLRPSAVAVHRLVPVGAHAGWGGEITRIRLRVSNSVESVDLGPLRIVTPEGRFDRVHHELAGTVGKAVLESEARLGLVAAAGEPRSWSVQAAESSLLRFGYGPFHAGIGPSDGTLQFTVSARRPDGEETPLFTDEIEVGPPATWRDAQVPLDGAGPLDLQFRVAWSPPDGGEGDYDGAPPPLAVWTNPRVVDGTRLRRHPNVFLFALDTLRADRLAVYGYEHSPMPRLSEFAEGAVVFEDVSANAPWSLASYASLFTSFYPSTIGVVEASHALPANGPATLAELFRQAGYRTLALTGGGYAGRHYGMARGFERFWEGGDPEELTTRLESWIGSEPETPALVYVHSYEAHDYFRATRSYLEAAAEVVGRQPSVEMDVYEEFIRKMGRDLDPEQIDEIGNLYLGGLRTMDRWFERWLSLIEGSGQAEESIIAVLSDHGEAFGEHGRVHHGNGVFQELVGVPFIVKVPEGLEITRRRVAQPISLVDVTPTLLELAGLPPLVGLQGRSAVAYLLGEGPPLDATPPFLVEAHLVNDFALRQGNWKYLYLGGPDACGAADPGTRRYCERAYDLHEDPEELADGAGDPTRLAELRASFVDALLAETPGLRAVVMGGVEPATLQIALNSRGGPGPLPSRIWYPESDDRVKADSGSVEVSAGTADLDIVSWDRLPEEELVELELSIDGRGDWSVSVGPACSDVLEAPVDLGALIDSAGTVGRYPFPDSPRGEPTVCLLYTPPRAAEQQSVPTPEVLERLRALGYIR